LKLIKCYIENFGKLHNYSYNFEDGLNIIKEENGFGKTTFATFIKSMFYGLDSAVNVKTEKSDRKKIKEISVDLSPKKKLNLANSNQNLGRRINNIQNNININPNKNSKIESCIITFDKNPKNPNKNKLSNSLDKIVPDNNKIRYIKKKVIISNNRKNLYNQKETPGFNNNQINKDGNEIKVYQKPGKETLSRSIGKSIENLEYSGEVKDYCAPSPDYGKKGKEAFLNAQKNKNKYLNNNSPYLSSSGKFQIFESNKKEKSGKKNKSDKMNKPNSILSKLFSVKSKLNIFAHP